MNTKLRSANEHKALRGGTRLRGVVLKALHVNTKLCSAIRLCGVSTIGSAGWHKRQRLR